MSFLKESARSSTHKFKSICIFGGTDLGKDQVFWNAAHDLGRVLAARKINVVYGGGIQGLRGRVAASAITRGSSVLGVVSKDGNAWNASSLALGTELKVDTMQNRMAHMMHNADAFIALPGGLETMEDVFTIVSWAKLNYHRKPLGFLNVNGFYNGLLSFLQQVVQQGFMPYEILHLIMSSSNADQLLDRMEGLSPESYAPPKRVDSYNKDDRKGKGPDTTLGL